MLTRSSRRTRRRPALAAALGLLCLLGGLAAAQPAATQPAADEGLSVTASLLDDGRILLGGKAVEIAQLPRRLKAAGATPQTEIVIAILPATPEGTLKTISRALASAGFRRILFVKPKRAVSQVGGAHP